MAREVRMDPRPRSSGCLESVAFLLAVALVVSAGLTALVARGPRDHRRGRRLRVVAVPTPASPSGAIGARCVAIS